MMAVMLIFRGRANSVRAAEIIYDVAALAMSWTCAVTVAGYGRKYLDRNSWFRKTANEAIYPLLSPSSACPGHHRIHGC